MRCALNAITDSTAFITFSRIHFGITNVATSKTIPADKNLENKRKNLILILIIIIHRIFNITRYCTRETIWQRMLISVDSASM